MSTSRTKAVLINISFLIFVAMTLSTLVFAGDKQKSAPPPSKPAAKPAPPAPQMRPAPQVRQVPPAQPNRAPNSRIPSPAGGGRGITGRGGPGLASGGGGITGHGGTGSTGRTGTGPTNYVSRPGDQAKVLPGGRTEFRNPNGRAVTTNARGEVQRIEAPRGLAGGNKMVINRGPGGARVVETGRPGARVVSYGSGRGFVERPLRPGYISRTYVVGGRSYANVYRESSYRGAAYNSYVPAVYYGPQFYAWAATPWGAPMPYAWSGLATPAPWLGFYPGYFTPYSAYASPDLWLTDYLISENLRLAYENQRAANADQAPPAADTTPSDAALSPETKALIEDEIRQQLAAEKAAAAQPTPSSSQQSGQAGEQLPPALKQKFFVVSTNLDINTATGQVCSLTPGDMIQRRGTDVTADGVAVEVIKSKPGSCPVDSAAKVQFADLQEMSNQFREQIDSGLTILAAHQAKTLPSGPDAGSHPVPEGTADPIPDAGTQLATQESDAAKLEAQVREGGN